MTDKSLPRLARVPLEAIDTSALPRDRLSLNRVAADPAMAGLKHSLRAHGQRDPVEVFEDETGRMQLKTGWRRWTALRQLHAKTGEARFATIEVRVVPQMPRLEALRAQGESNMLREDLSFAELAQLAITAAEEARGDAHEMVGTLFAALPAMKRSYIRQFVFLLQALHPGLKWPAAVPRNLGVDVARALRTLEQAEALRIRLAGCRSVQSQTAALTRFLRQTKRVAKGLAPPPAKPSARKEICVGQARVIAQSGSCRIVSDRDYAQVPDWQLEGALRAFEAAIATSARLRRI